MMQLYAASRCQDFVHPTSRGASRLRHAVLPAERDIAYSSVLTVGDGHRHPISNLAGTRTSPNGKTSGALAGFVFENALAG